MSLILSFRKRKSLQISSKDDASSMAHSSPSVLPEQGLPIRKSPPHTSLPAPDQSPPPHVIDVMRTSTPPPSLARPPADIDLTATPTSQSPKRWRPTVTLLVTVMPLSELDKQSLGCPICFDDYDEYLYTKESILHHTDHPVRLDYTITGGIRSPLCGHIFGRDCLEEYLEAGLLNNIKNYKCPTCSISLYDDSHPRPSHWSIIPCDLWIPRTHLSLQNFGSQSSPYGFEEVVQMVVDAFGIEDIVERLKANADGVLEQWKELKRDRTLGPYEEEIQGSLRDLLLVVGRLGGGEFQRMCSEINSTL